MGSATTRVERIDSSGAGPSSVAVVGERSVTVLGLLEILAAVELGAQAGREGAHLVAVGGGARDGPVGVPLGERDQHPPLEVDLAEVDPALGGLIARVGEFNMRPEPAHSLFQVLIRSIVYQQLTGRAAATILGRVTRLFAPKRFPTPGDLLDIAPELLRGAGLSTAKTAALRDLAARALDGTVPTLSRVRRMHDEEIIERLTAVRGVGRWTVEMLLIFKLGRPDVLPVSDLGV